MEETRVESWGLSINLKAKNCDFNLKLFRFVGGQRFGDANHLLPPKRSLLQKIRESLGKLKGTLKKRACRGIASRTDGRTPRPDVSKPVTRIRLWPLNQVERSQVIANSQFLAGLAYMQLVGRIILYTVKGVLCYLLLLKNVLTRKCPRPMSLSASLISLLGFIIYFLGCSPDKSHVSKWLESTVAKKMYLFN